MHAFKFRVEWTTVIWGVISQTPWWKPVSSALTWSDLKGRPCTLEKYVIIVVTVPCLALHILQRAHLHIIASDPENSLPKALKSLRLARGETQRTNLRDCSPRPPQNLLLELIPGCSNSFCLRGNSQWNKNLMWPHASSCSAVCKHCFGSNFSRICLHPHSFLTTYSSLVLQHLWQFLGKHKRSHVWWQLKWNIIFVPIVLGQGSHSQ